MFIKTKKEYDKYTEIYEVFTLTNEKNLKKIKFHNNIDFCLNNERGYGECDRLYDYSTHKGIDFGVCYDGTQSGTHPSGDGEEIAKMLCNLSLGELKKLMDKHGETSCCCLYKLWDKNKLKSIISEIREESI